MSEPTLIHLVPHTHWDREWYVPFQTFRIRLVALVDGLLDEMDADPSVRFTLDGQTATVDDYLEVRPEHAERIKRLVEAGRLSVGPWHILMDEFLVSGETIVRNLELGMRNAERMGSLMRVGYLPDMFGHIAQMPQILRRAGIEDAVVWRGVPFAIRSHVFNWLAPDGSSVRCEYLYQGYGNARDVLSRAEAIDRKLETYAQKMQPWFGSDELLAMYGEDHSIPAPGYAGLVAAFNAEQSRFQIQIETLAEYVAETRERSRPRTTWTGELRSSARANVLMGVTSHHIDVRQAAARAERTIERYAEPLSALHVNPWPRRLLELAWRRLIENSAHDSICACSADAVVAQVLVRFAEAEQIGTSLVDRALAEIAAEQPERAWIAVNPSPFEREDLIELVFDEPPETGDAAVRPSQVRLADGRLVPVQELEREHLVLDDLEIPASGFAEYLRVRLHARELYRAYVDEWTFHETEPLSVVLHVVPTERVSTLDIDEMLEVTERRAREAADASWRLRVIASPQRRILARVPVPALGWAGVQPGLGESATHVFQPEDRVIAGNRSLRNGLVQVAVDDIGTLRIEGGGVVLTGVGRLVDGGDAGDSYNYAPPAAELLVDSPELVSVDVTERGPLRGRLIVHRRYSWPLGLDADAATRSSAVAHVEVATTVELRAGEPFVRLRVAFDNPSRDHRVRFHIPLPAPVRSSFAEGQFAVVARGLTMEGGHGEVPLPTFPAHGFAAIPGVVALLQHIVEYEIVADGSELALTLLRATGVISRDANAYRAEPAGPGLPTPAAQLIGPRAMDFALLPHAGDPDASVLDALERYRLPFLAREATGRGETPLDARPGLGIRGQGIVLSALGRRDGSLEARLVNETSKPSEALVTGSFRRSRTVDLAGAPLADWSDAAGRLSLNLGPWEFRTVQLDDGR